MSESAPEGEQAAAGKALTSANPSARAHVGKEILQMDKGTLSALEH
jgi:hypothetical protein